MEVSAAHRTHTDKGLLLIVSKLKNKNSRSSRSQQVTPAGNSYKATAVRSKRLLRTGLEQFMTHYLLFI